MNELYHHGIKGQKWGVRRFQNNDGAYTSAGKKRRNSENNATSKSKSGVGKKIATGLAIGAAAGLAAYGLSKVDTRKISDAIWMRKMTSPSGPKLQVASVSPKVKEFMSKYGKKALTALGESGKAAGKAAASAAVASIGTIAVTKITSAIASKVNTGNADLDRVITDSMSAGVRSAFYTNSSNSGGKYKSGPVDRAKGAEISKIVGPPKQKEIDRSGPAYQALFKNQNGDQRDPDTRGLIKSMASAGYGIDQISEYLNMLDNGSIKHSIGGSDMYDFLEFRELYHHGIKGQRWGVRRFQNADGSLKAAGKKRYGEDGGTNKSSGPKGKVSGSESRKAKIGAALKKAGKVALGVAKSASISVAASTSSGSPNKFVSTYGSHKIDDFSDDARDDGRDFFENSKNIHVSELHVNNYEAPSADDMVAAQAKQRAEERRQQKLESIPSDVKKDMGRPSNKEIDKDSDDYKDLFKQDSLDGRPRKEETRKLIKDLADAGYSTKQIQKKLESIDKDYDSPYNEHYDPRLASGWSKSEESSPSYFEGRSYWDKDKWNRD